MDGWQCVCKEMNPEGTPSVSVEYFEKEITLLENLPHHRNIVRYLFHDMQHGKIRLFMTRYRSSLLFIVRAAHPLRLCVAPLSSSLQLYDRFKQQAYITAQKIRLHALEIIKGLEVRSCYATFYPADQSRSSCIDTQSFIAT